MLPRIKIVKIVFHLQLSSMAAIAGGRVLDPEDMQELNCVFFFLGEEVKVEVML